MDLLLYAWIIGICIFPTIPFLFTALLYKIFGRQSELGVILAIFLNMVLVSINLKMLHIYKIDLMLFTFFFSIFYFHLLRATKNISSYLLVTIIFAGLFVFFIFLNL